MNEISFQNNITKVSGAKDGIQSKDTKNEGSSFKGILDKVSSSTDSKVKKNLEGPKNTIDERKAECTNNNGTKVVYDNKDKATNSDENEAINDNRNFIKLSSKELAKLKEILAKLQVSSDSQISIDDKSELNLDRVMQIIKGNLYKLNDVLKNKNLSMAIGDNVDLINELNEMKNQIENLISAIDTATALGDQSSKEAKDILNADLSEHSTNAEKNETNDPSIKASDTVLALCGMASILSEIAALKAENSTEESVKEIQALNKDITTIEELIKSSNQIGPENQKDYEELGAAASKVISNSKLGVKIDQFSISTLPNAKEATDEIVNLMSSSKDDMKVDSDLEKLINKFIGQADKLEQKLAFTKDANMSVEHNTIVDTKGKINFIVKKKLLDRDFKIDVENTKVIPSKGKAGTLSNDAIENSKQTSNDVEKANRSLNTEEDKLLLKLSSDDTNSSKDDLSNKIARVTNLATSLQTEKNLSVENSEKLPVVNRQTFNEDLVKSLKYMELNDVKELTVKVVPKELGELFIKITREGEVVKAQITATNRDAYNALNSNLTEITNKLSEQNIKIHSFNVEIYNGDSSFLNQGSKNENGNSKGRRKNSVGNLEVEEVGNPEEITYDLNNLNALA
ncbi:flagellar hook-length control protein FliK [Clostridium omnivorum]|uniref:Flagellar hook-length control protein-like C-terminal domain-containing protein n=1 Tax=Clostridium omnivorum TaxID=1604902 RepID=A0ABQ5NAR9_9CLOT|nr:flagellar hook-length control protein FliK [Clostridium sp. E14]GLC32354.1 hypothetical protein bsdE14_37640 [Clostridium sp. E14]